MNAHEIGATIPRVSLEKRPETWFEAEPARATEVAPALPERLKVALGFAAFGQGCFSRPLLFGGPAGNAQGRYQPDEYDPGADATFRVGRPLAPA
jgi:hypothetical protein